MFNGSNTAALQLVREELIKLCHQAGDSVDLFVTDWQQRASLDNVLHALLTARGTYELLELPAARSLCQEALELVQELPFEPDNHARAQLETLSYSLALLARYTDYIAGKTCDIPELLLPTINQLRTLKGLGEYTDCHFFHTDSAAAISARPAHDDLIYTGRRQRLLLQLGLLHMLTKAHIEPGIKLMQHSANVLSEMSQDAAADIWRLTSEYVQSFPKRLPLTMARKRLLSQVERYLTEQLKAAHTGGYAAPSPALLRSLLYHCSLIESRSAVVDKLLARYHAPIRAMNHNDLIEAGRKLAAPAESTYRHVLEQVREEITSIHGDLRHKQVAAPSDEIDAALLIAAVRRLGQTLTLVEQNTLADELLLAASALTRQELGTFTATQGCIHDLLNALARVRLGLDSRLNGSRVRSELESQDRHAPAIDENRAATLNDVRNYFRELMQSFDNYVASEGSRSHILQSPVMLQRICHALTFSKLERLAEPLQEVSSVLEGALAAPPTEVVPREILLVLADIFTATDYALECQSLQQPIPIHVEQLTQRALQDLRELRAVA